MLHLQSNPKKLFLVDAVGASATAVLLFAVLKQHHEYFGMPESVLFYLSAVALVFCFYSTTCYLFVNQNQEPFLKTIGIANLMYCFLTMGLMLYYYNRLTVLGIAYFAIEIAIICGLVFVEIKTANALGKAHGAKP